MTDPKQELIDELCERFKEHLLPLTGPTASIAVRALRELFDDAFLVTRQNIPQMDCWKWGESNPHGRRETHQALLIGIRPIKRKVKAQEIIDLLRRNDNLHSKKLSDMADRIEQHGLEVE